MISQAGGAGAPDLGGLVFPAAAVVAAGRAQDRPALGPELPRSERVTLDLKELP